MRKRMCKLQGIRCWFALVVGLLSSPVWGQGKSGVSPSVLSLPQGPGSLGGIGQNVSANLNMGLMSYPIAMILPEGRGGFTPSLGVSYSSSGGSGVMGIGWSLSVGGAVERMTARGLPTYTNKDLFYGGGELVKIPNSPFYRARYEGSFVRYRWHQSSTSDQRGFWVAENPDGSKEYYGADHTGKVDLSSQVYGTQGTFRWLLRARVDRNGNRIAYKYFRVGSQLYLEQIQWVFDKQGKALYRINIKYEDRPDPISDCKPGFDLRTTKRTSEVTIFSEGQRIRSYKFQFDAGSGLSRLTQVTRYGIDPTKAHPVQFTIKYSEATFSAQNSRMVRMNSSVGQNFKAGNSDLVDMNGDGLPDVVNTSSTTHKFYMNVLTLDKDGKQSTHDFPSNAVVTSTKPILAKLSNDSVQMLDVNGDGFTDMVDAVNQLIYLNKGNSQWEANSETLKSFPKMGSSPDLRFFDYNGDKKIDVIRSDRHNTVYWVNDGNGSWKQVTGSQAIGASFSQDKVRLIDINGDGLQDAVQIISGKLRYRKYLGYGKWSGWIDVVVPGLADKKLGDKPRFRDINGDGMADMVAFVGTSILYFVNKNGVEFRAGQELSKMAGVDLPNSDSHSVRIADMNGNGSRDIVWISNGGNITYLELFSKRPNLLQEISNSIGQRVNVSYGSSVYHYLRDKSCDKANDKTCGGPWKNKMPMAFTVVNTITTWASHSRNPTNQSTPTDVEKAMIQRLYYHDGYYDGKENQFRGFRHAQSVYDGDDSLETRFEDILFNVGDQDPYFHGRMMERTLRSGGGKIYFKESYEWKDCGTLAGVDSNLSPPVRFICRSALETQLIEGETDKARWKTLRTEWSYNGYGQVKLASSLGDKDKQGDELYRKNTFVFPDDPKSPDSLWILNRRQKEEICEKLEGPCAETRYYYDGKAYEGLPLGQMTHGNVSRVAIRTQVGQDDWYIPLRRAYDSFGNMIGFRGNHGQKRSIAWDTTYQRFAISETIHLKGYDLTASTEWDPRYSKVVRSTNFNQQVTQYTFDNFGQLRSVLRPGDAPNKPSLRYTIELKAPLSRVITEVRSTADGPYDRKKILCFDGRGRKRSTRLWVKGNTYLVKDKMELTRVGLPARIWDSFEGKEACSFAMPAQGNSVQYWYDAQHRMTKTQLADGSIRTVQMGPLRASFFDEEDNDPNSPHANTPTILIKDGLFRLVEKLQTLQGGQTLSTGYKYTMLNPHGVANYTTVTFADGSQKKHSYNLAGKMMKIIDPDRSEITFQYDNDMRLTGKTDGRGKTSVYTYDEADRLTSIQEKDRPETRTTMGYDRPHPSFPGATFLKGKQSWLQSPTNLYMPSYDKWGHLQLARHKLMGVVFDFAFRHNPLGDVLEQTLPDQRKNTYVRDGIGRLTSIPGKLKSIIVSPADRIQSWQAANGVTTTYRFDKRLRLLQISANAGKVMQLDYTLDRNSNITQLKQAHGITRFTNTYQYDALYRLTQANVGSQQETLTYQQDVLHNLTSKVSSLGSQSPAHVGSYTFDAKKIHAVTEAGSKKMRYDDSGNMTQHGTIAYSWDYLGRCTKAVFADKSEVKNWYGAGNERVIQEESGLHSFRINHTYEYRDGAFVHYTYLGNDRIVAGYSTAFAATFFDDLAPLQGNQPKPDGVITAADAWVYYASRKKILTAKPKARPHDLDLTRDMLQVSLTRLLQGNREVQHYYHPDHIGSVRAITDSEGKVIARQHYYPYGATRVHSGITMPFGYMGARYEAATQTYDYGIRSLDPKLGRWLSPDPMFESTQGDTDEANSYGSVVNNPIRMRDVRGNNSESALEQGLAYTAFGLAAVGTTAFSVVRLAQMSIPVYRHRLVNDARVAALGRGNSSIGKDTAASKKFFFKITQTHLLNRIRTAVGGLVASAGLGLYAFGDGGETASSVINVITIAAGANGIASKVINFKFNQANHFALRHAVEFEGGAALSRSKLYSRTSVVSQGVWGLLGAVGTGLSVAGVAGGGDFGYLPAALMAVSAVGNAVSNFVLKTKHQAHVSRTLGNVPHTGNSEKTAWGVARRNLSAVWKDTKATLGSLKGSSKKKK